MSTVLFEDDYWFTNDVSDEPYFLGSIVVSGLGKGVESILDGQQRLTTISLLLAVLKFKLQELGYNQAHRLSLYLEGGSFGSESFPKIKLQPEDEKVYSAMLAAPSKCNDQTFKKSLIASAVEAIDWKVEEIIEKANLHGVTRQEVLEKMALRITRNIEFVRISAPSESQAFRLFEALNDRGLDLTAADLIKNKLLEKCGDAQIDEMKEVWQDVIEAVGISERVSFLRYYWIATQDEVRKDKLYDVYSVFIKTKKNPDEVLGFADEMRRAAEVYSHIAEPDPKKCPWGADTSEGLLRLNSFRARSCRPALLSCALSLGSNQMTQLARACETITIRCSVVGGKNPNQLEKAYGNLCKAIKNNPNSFSSALQEEFAGIVPSDMDFASDFARLRVDRTSDSWRQILIRLNEIVSTGETRILGPSKVHVEHILPKSPSKEALKEAGITKEEADDAASRIGNLTLLSGLKNRILSNGPFSRKQPDFAKSEIALNHEIAKAEKWSVEEIENRSKQLGQLAVKVWPWPV
jgi:hypothetical protein